MNSNLERLGLISSFLQNETLPLDPPAPMIILWVITFLFCYILLNAKLITRRIGIYLITLLFGGVLLGGIPNVVLPIQETLTTIGIRGDMIHMFHPSAVLFFILYSSMIVGRIFCGFVCPIGTLQELISKINFKSDLYFFKIRFRGADSKVLTLIKVIKPQTFSKLYYF